MDGSWVDMVNRHPAATAAGIDTAAALNLAADRLTLASSGCPAGARCYDVLGGDVPNCRITYQEATIAAGVIVAPTISVATTGC